MGVVEHINSLFSSVTYCENAILVDPGDEWDRFKNVRSALLTHAHFDHIYGLNRVLELNLDVKVYTNSVGKEMLLNPKKNLSFYHEVPFVFKCPENIVVVNDGDVVGLDEGIVANAIFTPGHNPSCITWLIGDNLFTGDAYIPGIKTVTNLPGGNKVQAEESITIIKELSNGRLILPGHKI